jgi:sugar phosphate isomerase/epimerase
MGMDGHRVATALGDRVGHAHGKDTIFHPDALALNGLLDARWPQPADQMPWTFGVPGRGHDLAWWTGLMRALAGSQCQVVSIEHEDPFIPAEQGVPEAARLLRAAIDASEQPGEQPVEQPGERPGGQPGEQLSGDSARDAAGDVVSGVA